MEPNIAKRIYNELKREFDKQFEKKFEEEYKERFFTEIKDIFQVDIPSLLTSGVLRVEDEKERNIILKWTKKYYNFFTDESVFLMDDYSSEDELTSDSVETPTTEHPIRQNNETSIIFEIKDTDQECDNVEEYTRKLRIMNEKYPNLPFNPNVNHLERLDYILVNSNSAIIYLPLKCVFCCPNQEGAEVINIRRNSFITYNDFYTECNNNWSSELCNCRFLECLEIKNNFIIEPCIGP